MMENVDQDRKHAIDAAIVRTMKSRKVLQHQQVRGAHSCQISSSEMWSEWLHIFPSPQEYTTLLLIWVAWAMPSRAIRSCQGSGDPKGSIVLYYKQQLKHLPACCAAGAGGSAAAAAHVPARH